MGGEDYEETLKEMFFLNNVKLKELRIMCQPGLM